MIALWFVTIFTTMFLGVSTYQNIKQADHLERSYAHIFEQDLLGYRRALINYKALNPGVSGNISNAALGPTMEWGDTITNSNIGNTIENNTAYVWATGNISPTSQAAVFNTLGGSLMIGVNQSGVLRSFKNKTTIDTGIILPVTVPNGAFVIVGD